MFFSCAIQNRIFFPRQLGWNFCSMTSGKLLCFRALLRLIAGLAIPSVLLFQIFPVPLHAAGRMAIPQGAQADPATQTPTQTDVPGSAISGTVLDPSGSF